MVEVQVVVGVDHARDDHAPPAIDFLTRPGVSPSQLPDDSPANLHRARLGSVSRHHGDVFQCEGRGAHHDESLMARTTSATGLPSPDDDAGHGSSGSTMASIVSPARSQAWR